MSGGASLCKQQRRNWPMRGGRPIRAESPCNNLNDIALVFMTRSRHLIHVRNISHCLDCFYPTAFSLLSLRTPCGMAKGQSERPSQNVVKVKGNTHIERTASQFRQSVSGFKIIHSDTGKGFFLAEIESFRQGSPSVRLIQLKILPPSPGRIDGLPNHPCEVPQLFTFLPGQWIDTYVPHLPKPGGFSFVSTPKYFRSRGLIALSIQLTENPPSKWLWRDDIIGQKLMVRVGGNFTFPPSGKLPELSQVDYLQFVAGGVGIKFGNPRTIANE